MSSGANIDETVKRVRFNVGGHMYEISRDIVMKYPETMLARSISGTWQSDPNGIVFINGDGNRFGYILDYLRTGRIFVPLSVPKDAILSDLEYYGFENVAPNVSSDSFEAAIHMAKKEKEFAEKVKSLKQEIAYRKISHYCFKHHSVHGSVTRIPLGTVLVELVNEKNHYFFTNFVKEVFDAFLEEYGFYFIGLEQVNKFPYAYLNLGHLTTKRQGPV